MKKINLNSDACIGCGACVAICPEYFAFDGGVSKVIKENTEVSTNNLLEAVDACPVSAISLEEN